jgi:hypothetical protein
MSKLTTVRKVANNTLQCELVDTIDRLGTINVLALLNKGDTRFTQSNARKAWFKVTLESLQQMGVNALQLETISKLEKDQKFELNIEDPEIDGHLLRIQINESIIPDVYQRQNATKAAKQIMIDADIAKSKINTNYDLSVHVGKNGYFLDGEGNFIFSKANVTIQGQVNHTFIKGTLVPETELASYGATLAENVNIEEKQEKF